MFIAFIEITRDIKKVREISERIDDEREQFPDRYPKQPCLEDGSIAQFMLGGNTKAFSLYETDTPEQLYRLAQCYEGERARVRHKDTNAQSVHKNLQKTTELIGVYSTSQELN
jgi:hypothetical protein